MGSLDMDSLFTNITLEETIGIKTDTVIDIKKLMLWIWDHLLDILWPIHFLSLMKNNG